MNNVQLLGYVTKNPDLRYTKSGSAVCQFTLAVDKGLSKDKKAEFEANNRPTADFPRIIVWGKMGENASRYLKKGSQCAIEGAIQTGSYQDRETGKTIYTTDIIADRVEFLDSRNNAQNNAGATRGQSRSNYTNNGGNFNTGQNMGDFFEDDFQEIEDDNRIPF